MAQNRCWRAPRHRHANRALKAHAIRRLERLHRFKTRKTHACGALPGYKLLWHRLGAPKTLSWTDYALLRAGAPSV